MVVVYPAFNNSPVHYLLFLEPHRRAPQRSGTYNIIYYPGWLYLRVLAVNRVYLGLSTNFIRSRRGCPNAHLYTQVYTQRPVGGGGLCVLHNALQQHGRIIYKYLYTPRRTSRPQAAVI